MLIPLHGQVALVTGATSGIGNAIARALGAGGARLGLVGRSLGTLEAVARDMGAVAPPVKLYGVDLADEAQVQALAAGVQEDLGGVDILVHSAGVFERAGFEATSDAAFDRQYRLNLRAPQILTRLLAPSLRARRGQVVFVNSSVARGARAGLSQYAATKAGLKAVADSFREEFNPAGVRVLSVFAGRTATPMQERIFEQEGRPYEPEHLLQPADIAAVVANALSLPRTAEVTEIDIRPMKKT
jgi:NADP-dependent 3-hydroxy acid dehydrogenase YdfG